ncbi:hypothetical protein [Methylotenera sp.]|uniref:hypothetical protein n=1 Tax=Methylotenera sp. TaxID=2051956 RepID=UPI0024883847|nr:hypothetical protein [Methylotenera sp.]MDI1298851.1 hypothetical protein [Methylotenera sp.]
MMNDKILTALVVSALMHVALVLNLKFINCNLSKYNIKAELTAPNLSTDVLQVGFLVLSQPKPQSIQNELELTGHDRNKEETHAQFERSQEVQLEPEIIEHGLPLNNATVNTSNSGDKLTNKQYYKSSEVDMSAIPIHGIEQPTMLSGSKLLEVYQLRVFISKNGIVDRVVNLNKDRDSQLFYSQVEEQVKNLTFIPAKKNGVAVDSYIDITLENK